MAGLSCRSDDRTSRSPYGHALNRWFFEHRILTRRNSWHAWLWIAFVLFYMF